MSFMPDYLGEKNKPGTKLPPKLFDPLPPGAADEFPTEEEVEKKGWELKVLKPKHKQIASLLAQGCGRDEVAKICGCAPQHVNVLMKQEVFRNFLKDMTMTAEEMLNSQFVGAVEAIGDALRFGDVEERLKAARLQMEASGRLGNRANIRKEQDTSDRLERLSHRLIDLLAASQPSTGRVIDEEANVPKQVDHELREPYQRSQDDGDGDALSQSESGD